MEKIKVRSSIKIFVIITYILMIAVNGLANALPINGMNTGNVSDAYPNLFAPAGITFSIWGVIYILLAIYTLYQVGLFPDKAKEINSKLINKVGIMFSLSSLANAAWIFAWHYQRMLLSLLLMAVILLSLITINMMIDKENLSSKEKLFIRLPFSVYFGWITIATIANATTLLVSVGWSGFGLAESSWTIILLMTGVVIGGATAIKLGDIAYGVVLIWAYSGIWIKHVSESGFSGQYPAVITAVMICIAVFIAMVIYLFYTKSIKLQRHKGETL